ncbi:MAG: hypothetical protein IKF59_04350 [Lachnospiraceae bacterium]|nr:hypothetical protein [Lachnospiraceae bacterium]
MAGRKSKYETYVKPRFADIALWAKNGASEKEIAKNLGITMSTFSEYKKKFPEFSELLKKSRVSPIEEIKAAMVKRAVGFQYTEKRFIRQYIDFPDEIKGILEDSGVDISGLEKPELVRLEETVKTVLPNVAAGLVLLQHWDRNADGSARWSRDPAKLELQKEELELKKEKADLENW